MSATGRPRVRAAPVSHGRPSPQGWQVGGSPNDVGRHEYGLAHSRLQHGSPSPPQETQTASWQIAKGAPQPPSAQQG